MEMYGLFRIKRKVTMPRVAEYLVRMCSFEYPWCEGRVCDINSVLLEV